MPKPTPKPTPRYPAGSLTAAAAASHIGEDRLVCGHVATATYASSSYGSPTFLNLDRPYPNQIFTILIWVEHRSAYPQAPEVLFGNKDVCISGYISEYGGVPEIEDGGGNVQLASALR